MFRLRRLDHLTVHLRAARLVEADRLAGVTDRFQQVNRPQRIGLHGIDRLIEAHAHVRLRAKVVDLVRLNAREHLAQTHAIDEVAVVQKEAGLGVVRIFVEMVDAVGIERAAAPDQAMDFVILRQQELRQV